MAIGERPGVEQSNSPLSWLSEILWPNEEARLVPGHGNGAVLGGGHGEVGIGFSWWASPSAGQAEILIPAGNSAAARSAVRRYHDGFTLKRRSKSWAAELVMRSPGLARQMLGRQLVTVEGRPTDGVLRQLADTLSEANPDLTELHVAVSLSRPKSNRKPVLQLLDQDGLCLGWAKIGWNDWTDQLLVNEARWLRTRPETPLVTPTLLDNLTVADQWVIITSGAVASRWPQRQSLGPDPTLLTTIADLGNRIRSPLSGSPWWQSVEAVLSVATATESLAIRQVMDATQELVFDVGAWHGDLTPWNIMTTGRLSGLARGQFTSPAYQVIDWEFAADGAPLGFDLCHYHTQVGTEMKAMTADQALDYSARLSPQGLAELGIDPHNQIGVYRLYLVELIRRTLALRAAGMAVDNIKQGAAAVRRLRADLLVPTVAAVSLTATAAAVEQPIQR